RELLEKITLHIAPILYARLQRDKEEKARRQAEEAIRNSERRMADIINFLPDATFVIDTNGTVIPWNRAIENLLGVTADDILGKRDYESALSGYGRRRPILIVLALQADENVERLYYSN